MSTPKRPTNDDLRQAYAKLRERLKDDPELWGPLSTFLAHLAALASDYYSDDALARADLRHWLDQGFEADEIIRILAGRQ